MSEQYTPTTGEVRDSLVYLNEYHAKQYGDVDPLGVGSENAAQFDRMIAEVERKAAEEAWEACLDEAAKQGTIQEPDNPYRKAEE